jgi:hypothetical protein
MVCLPLSSMAYSPTQGFFIFSSCSYVINKKTNMKLELKLKQATLVDCDDKTMTVILMIQRKDKSIVEVELVADGRKKEPVTDFFNDYWNSIEVDGVLYDVNFWHEDKGLIRATLYPLRKNGEFYETITDKFSGCKMKFIPRSEYDICKQGLIKKMC